MKKVILALLLGVLTISSIFAEYFQPAWHQPYQNPYLAMNIYVYDAEVNGVHLGATDEIGVFDGTTCVGAITLDKPFAEYSGGVAHLQFL